MKKPDRHGGRRLPLELYFQRCCAALAWVSLAIIAYVTLGPLQQRPHAFSSAALERLVAFALLGFMFLIAHPRRPALVCTIVLGSAGLLEFLQTLTPDRHGRLIDAFEKILGGSVGMLAASVVLYVLRNGKAFRVFSE
jgi:VanZ family protein